MNITELLKGETTVGTLAKRLLEEQSKGSSRKAQSEMEAALLRLNPHLNRTGALKQGTPIVVPEEFSLAANESVTPMREMAEELLRQAETTVTNLRATLKDHAAQSAEQSERARTWLKSDQAKEFLRRSPELKAVFASAGAAAKTLPKEQAAAVAAQDKALDNVASALASFLEATRGSTGSSATDSPAKPSEPPSRPRRKSRPRTKRS